MDRSSRSKGVQGFQRKEGQEELKQILRSNMNTDQLKGRIRECLLRFEPAIFSCRRPPNVEGCLEFLEDMDEGAGGPDAFRQWLNASVDGAVRATVRAEVQQQCRDTRLTPDKMKMVAPAILSKILETHEMRSCIDNLQKATSISVQNMTDNFERELVLLGQLRSKANPSSRRENDLDSLASSTGSNFSLLNSGQFARLSEQLHPYMGAESRVEALKLLLSSQLCDVVGSPEWRSIKEGLTVALLDFQIQNISSLALKVHARIIGNMSPFCTKEAFVNIVDTLLRLFRDKGRSSIVPIQGSEISYKKKAHFNLLHIFKFLDQVAKDLPRYWIRYPESYVSEMVKSLLELVTSGESKQRRGPSSYTALEFLALVDPKAKWLQSWMHGKFSRALVLNEVRECNILLKNSLQVVTTSVEALKQSPLLMARGSSKGKGIISPSLVSYSGFAHSLKVGTLLLLYKSQISDSSASDFAGINIESVVTSWTNHVSSATPKSSQNALNLITQSLIKLLSKSRIVESLCANKLFVKTLTMPLVHLEEELRIKGGKIALTGSSIENITNNLMILNQILDVPAGLEAILDNSLELRKDLILADFLLHLTTKAFNCFDNLPKKVVAALLEMSTKLLGDHKTVLRKTMVGLSDVLSEVFIDLDYQTSRTPTNNGVTLNASTHEDYETKLVFSLILTFFTKLMSTPGGSLLASKSQVLDNIIKQVMAKTDRAESQSIILQNLSMTVTGEAVIEELGIVHDQISRIQEDSIFHQPTGRETFSHPSPDEIEEFNYSSVQKICSLLACNQNIEMAMTNDIFQAVVMLNTDAIFCSFAENEFAFALQLVLSSCSSLDSFCLLQKRFKVLDHVAKLKSEYQLPFGVPVLDKVTIFCDFILSYLGSIGGDKEKNLPSLNLTAESIKQQKIYSESSEDDLAFQEELQKLKVNGTKLKQFVNSFLTRNPTKSLGKGLKLILDELLKQDDKETFFTNRKAAESSNQNKEDVFGVDLAVDLFAKYFPAISRDHIKMLTDPGQEFLPPTCQQFANHFDWFAAMVLAVYEGDIAKCQKFLAKFWPSSIATFLWPRKQGFEVLLKCCHHVDAILLEDLPLVYHTLHSNGVAVSTVVSQWWAQVFINTFNWPEICNYVGLVIVNGPEYVVYSFVAVFNHLRDQILNFAVGSQHRGQDDLLLFLLRVTPVKGFCFGSALPYMKKLEEKHKLSLK